MDIINRVEYKVVTSNVVYPLDKGYFFVAKLDEKWVKERLKQINWYVEDIGNKYLIKIKSNSGKDLLVTNNDGSYYLCEK